MDVVSLFVLIFNCCLLGVVRLYTAFILWGFNEIFFEAFDGGFKCGGSGFNRHGDGC